MRRRNHEDGLNPIFNSQLSMWLQREMMEISPKEFFEYMTGYVTDPNQPTAPEIKIFLEQESPIKNIPWNTLIERTLTDLKDPDGYITTRIIEENPDVPLCRHTLCEMAIEDKNGNDKGTYLACEIQINKWSRQHLEGRRNGPDVNPEIILGVLQTLGDMQITLISYLEECPERMLKSRQYETLVNGGEIEI